MRRRGAWLVTALVVVGLGAAGLYANHRAGSDVPTTELVPTKESVASVPAGVDKPVGKGSEPGDDAAGESTASKPAEPDAPPEETKVVPSPPPAEPDQGGAAEQSSDDVPTGNVPAHSPRVRNLDRYGDREPYEGVPHGQAPDTRGGAGRGN